MAELLTPDICIIGAGSGGLLVAAGASQLGANVVLLERNKMGGDCLNYGCIPSKAIIAAGKAAQLEADRPGRAEHDWTDVRGKNREPRPGVSWGRHGPSRDDARWPGLAHDWR